MSCRNYSTGVVKKAKRRRKNASFVLIKYTQVIIKPRQELVFTLREDWSAGGSLQRPEEEQGVRTRRSPLLRSLCGARGGHRTSCIHTSILILGLFLWGLQDLSDRMIKQRHKYMRNWILVLCGMNPSNYSRLRTWKEHIKDSSTLIMPPALSNSPQ